MTARMILALTMLIGSGIAPVFAEPAQQGLTVVGDAAVRNPELGDPGAQRLPSHMTAQQLARADRQGAGTENGNQPDRAEAGGGAH